MMNMNTTTQNIGVLKGTILYFINACITLPRRCVEFKLLRILLGLQQLQDTNQVLLLYDAHTPLCLLKWSFHTRYVHYAQTFSIPLK